MAENPCSSVLGIMISEPSHVPSSSAGGDDSPPVMPEDLFCRRLSRFGQSIGLFVYLFCASQVAGGSSRLINGFRLKHGRWQQGSFPLPDVLYDRSLPRTNVQYKLASCALAELKRLKPYILLNGSLPGKLDVYRELERDSQLSPWLPSTYKYEGASDLTQLMKQYPEGLFLKPSAGSHGKGALRLLRRDDGWHIDGRDRKNRPLAVIYDNWQDACRWIHRFVASVTYIVQPYLPLTGKDGRSYDVRVLIQKDESGKWSFTGAAVRTGERGSVTANLHGGGSAQGALEALTEQFDSETAGRLLGRIRWISERAAAALENHFGRLAELGIDYGIEQGGRVWLLEANAKPGRKALEGDESAARLAVERPIRYAMKLAAHRQPVYQFGRNQRRYIQEVHP
ncbi:YheC/YheD family protein [Paenibacillus lignilyticus]|uniref:YheC/YheD family protein n=1 Tax=Paenibacillus lignilyticus TaxID=1172615 RepID=A0ABS5C865_9BACL|nr:YheC/YheD family protein [Paenibacillus lignilyticus]MBP3962134.1 YheC/YheD family protein [Paenibacillus lignilyticus]